MSNTYDGQGGSYVVDPKTGVKTLIERTEPIDDTPIVEQTTEIKVTTVKQPKTKDKE